jgi:two-component system phosphate regulon sensor histidine kinase PhoR
MDQLWPRLVFLFLLAALLPAVGEIFQTRASASGRGLLVDHSDEYHHRDFVAVVSHELRTPLAAIQGYLETLEDDLKEGRKDDVPRYLEILRKNTGRLIEVCSDLLLLSRIEREEPPREACSTAKLTEEALTRLEGLRAEKNHAVEVSTQAATVFADERQLSQVLNNLLENAFRYMPIGGKVNVEWLPEPRGVRLVVRDNGPGIAPEHHARLFERFYRVDSGRSRAQGGTGLGLAVVKSIAVAHGGKVWVESRVGRGAAFHCYFPNDAT